MAESLQEFSLVCRSDIVSCDPGDDVVLSCHLQPAIRAASMEIKWHYRDDLICHHKDGEVTVSGGCEDRVSLSLQDLHNGNVSLTLRDVRAPQRGHYTCEVIYGQQTKKEYIFLNIISENVRLVSQNPTIYAGRGEEVRFAVHLLPETSAVSMKIQWMRRTHLISQYNCGQETICSDYVNRVDLSPQELERGHLSLTLRNVQKSDSGEYTCRVLHVGGQMQDKIDLIVKDKKKRDHLKMKSKYLNTIEEKKDRKFDLLQELSDDKLLVVEKNDGEFDLLQELIASDREFKKMRQFEINEKRLRPDDSTLRRTSSMDNIAPNLGDESTLERELTERTTSDSEPADRNVHMLSTSLANMEASGQSDAIGPANCCDSDSTESDDELVCPPESLSEDLDSFFFLNQNIKE